MKKLVALAVAAAITSPLALAANTPDNVGNVTYLGNIVANSPMWQWTVNDYPGGRLDAKPSTATTANGTTTYPLNGQAFIAASGYLPSFVGINLASGTSSTIGTRDITTLTDQKGAAPADITDAQKGAVTFTIAASGYDTTGQAVEGKLKLKATELRARRFAQTNDTNTTPMKYSKYTYIIADTSLLTPYRVGSCFAGIGSYTSANAVASGTSDNIVAGEQSPAAFAALIAAFNTADANGAAPPFTKLTGYANDRLVIAANPCATTTLSNSSAISASYQYDYMSAAHVLELTPLELQFSTPLSGAWNSTLTVTAYTM